MYGPRTNRRRAQIFRLDRPSNGVLRKRRHLRVPHRRVRHQPALFGRRRRELESVVRRLGHPVVGLKVGRNLSGRGRAPFRGVPDSGFKSGLNARRRHRWNAQDPGHLLRVLLAKVHRRHVRRRGGGAADRPIRRRRFRRDGLRGARRARRSSFRLLPNCRLMASCAAISSCCLARTSAVDVPAIQPSLHPTRFLWFSFPVRVAASPQLLHRAKLDPRVADGWMGPRRPWRERPIRTGRRLDRTRRPRPARGSCAGNRTPRAPRTPPRRRTPRRRRRVLLEGMFHLATQPRHAEPLNLLLERHRGTGRRGTPRSVVVGLPVPLGFVNASGARVGRNPNRRARSVAFFVRLAASDFCVFVIGLLALAKGTSARGLCCVGFPQPSRGPGSLGLVG